MAVWKSCQLTGTYGQLAALQLYEGGEGKKSKSHALKFHSATLQRTDILYVYYIEIATIDIFLFIHKVDGQINRQEH